MLKDRTAVNRNIYIQYRDFWNIVGRAGRAGKETEGKIIFMVNSHNDQQLYLRYIDRNNIEDAHSFIYKVLDAFIDGRINNDNFSIYLSILSETYLLDLITEEIIGTEYEEIIDKIINNSLFKIQIDKRQLNIAAVKQGFNKIFKSFEKETSIRQLSIYKITGFSFRSNKIIEEFIDKYKIELQKVVAQDDFIEIISYFLKFLAKKELSELEDYKLDNLKIEPIEYMAIIENWINGETIPNLIDVWEESTGKDVMAFHIFISKALYYLYPWGFSAFLIILAYKLNLEFAELPENILNLASYLKYGLNNPTSCLARSLGIKSRQVSIILFERSNHARGRDFIKWIANLTNEEIESIEISNFDKENLRDVALKLTPKSYRTGINQFEFPLKGTYYNPEWSVNSKDVYIGDILNYKREEQNEFDPYAIVILKKTSPLGYVPHEYSKLISTEIDIVEKEYTITVTGVINSGDYNTINIIMAEST